MNFYHCERGLLLSVSRKLKPTVFVCVVIMLGTKFYLLGKIPLFPPHKLLTTRRTKTLSFPPLPHLPHKYPP